MYDKNKILQVNSCQQKKKKKTTTAIKSSRENL